MGFRVYQGIFWSLVVSVVLRVGGVPTSQIDVDGSVLQTCGEKLSETTQSEVQYDNGTVVAEVETNHCVNIPKFVTCVKPALQQDNNWDDIDQALFGRVLDLDGLLASYRDMCSRQDYFDSKKGCLDDVGFDLLLFRCAASKFPSVYGIDKSSQHSNICSVYREHTNCTRRPPASDNCDKGFLDYIDRMNRQILQPDCRGLMYGDGGINASPRTARSVILTITTFCIYIGASFNWTF